MASAAATTTPALQAPIRPTSSAGPSTLIVTTAPSAATPTPAPESPASGTKIILVAPCSAWACWTRTQKDVVIAISALIGLAFVAVSIYIILKHRKRKRRLAELEKGPDVVDDRRKRGRRSRSRSRNRNLSLVGRWKGKERENGRGRSRSRKRGGIEGLENIEMGPAAARSLIESGVLIPTGGVTSTGALGEEKRFEAGGEYRMSGGLGPREVEKDGVLDQSDIHPLKREKRVSDLTNEAGMGGQDQAWRGEGDGKPF